MGHLYSPLYTGCLVTSCTSQWMVVAAPVVAPAQALFAETLLVDLVLTCLNHPCLCKAPYPKDSHEL